MTYRELQAIVLRRAAVRRRAQQAENAWVAAWGVSDCFDKGEPYQGRAVTADAVRLAIRRAKDADRRLAEEQHSAAEQRQKLNQQ